MNTVNVAFSTFNPPRSLPIFSRHHQQRDSSDNKCFLNNAPAQKTTATTMERPAPEAMTGPPPHAFDPEYPGVAWVRAYHILHRLKNGQPLPRHQDLPPSAFASRADATSVFAVTHPWLARHQPDPDGIQVQTLRAKLDRMFKQLTLEKNDVVCWCGTLTGVSVVHFAANLAWCHGGVLRV